MGNFMKKLIKHLPLLLFIGLAWGQLKVKSRYDLEPFTVAKLGQSTTIKFENGNMIKEMTSGDILFSGYYQCVDNNCSLTIKYDMGESKEIIPNGIDLIEDENEKKALLEWLKTKPEDEELIFNDINEIVKAISALIDYNFGANETEVEYELTGGSIKRTIDNNYTIFNNYKIHNIGDGVQFLNGIKGWQSQNPEKPKRVFVPYEKAPRLKGKLKVKIPPSYDGAEGVVILQAKISSSGNVDSVAVLKGVNTTLDSIAIKTLRKSKWRPAEARGKKVSVWTSVPINFRY